MTLAAAIAALALLQAPEPAPAAAPLGGPLWAVQAAQADLATLPPERRPHVRYLCTLDPGKATWAAVSVALNAGLSRSPFGVTPLDLHNGRMIRLDLSQLAINEQHAQNLYATYDSLANSEPFFHVHEPKLVETNKVFTDDRGRKHSGRWEVKSFVHPAIGPGYAELIAQTNSKAPLLVAEWFVIKALSTIEGGRYYQFRGLRDQSGKALFKLNEYLASRGANADAVAKLGSDERAAIIKSLVTGKPRRVDVFRGGGVRPSVGTGLVSVTHDISDGQTKVQNDPIANLLDLESAASETILEVANGFHEFALFNSEGILQDEVPPDIAADHTIPEPFTKRLQPAVSCLRCHGPHDGWQPFDNDVRKLASGDVQILGDLSAKSAAFDATTLVRLQGLYGGNLADPLRLGRNSYADVVFRNTGGMSIGQASDAVAGVWTRYEYSLVGAAEVLGMLGVAVPEGIEPVKVLRATIPPRPGVEDPLVVLLHKGVAIQRRQLERVWPDLLTRAMAGGAK